jgi:hypothetical protein
MEFSEFDAGTNQMIVVYRVPDTGNEIDPEAAFMSLAADAGKRSAEGWRIVSTTTMPLRHSAVAFGREGSGFETSATITVVYGK